MACSTVARRLPLKIWLIVDCAIPVFWTSLDWIPGRVLGVFSITFLLFCGDVLATHCCALLSNVIHDCSKVKPAFVNCKEK
jgi:hypothetical protein